MGIAFIKLPFSSSGVAPECGVQLDSNDLAPDCGSWFGGLVTLGTDAAHVVVDTNYARRGEEKRMTPVHGISPRDVGELRRHEPLIRGMATPHYMLVAAGETVTDADPARVFVVYQKNSRTHLTSAQRRLLLTAAAPPRRSARPGSTDRRSS
jgi:hypothetical protein